MSCCAYGCHSRFVDRKKLFALPLGKRDRKRRLTWLLRIGRANFTGTDSTRLCEDHFSQEQFEPLILKNLGVKKLKQDAVPSIFAPFVQIKQEVTEISTVDCNDHSLTSTHDIPNYWPSNTSEATLHISDIHTEDTPTADSKNNSLNSTQDTSAAGFKDTSLKCTDGVPNELSPTSGTTLQVIDVHTAGISNFQSATSETTLQITDIRTADTSTNGFKDPSLICRQGIPNSLSTTSDSTLKFSDIYMEGTLSDDVKDSSLHCTHDIQDSLAPRSESTLQISNICTAANSSVYNGTLVCQWPPPEGQSLPSLSNAELHKRMLDLESKLESARRKVQLANRIKNKVTKEYEKLKAELSHYLAPDQLNSMAKNSRGSLWSEDTIRKALKVRLACGSRGYNLAKKTLAPLPSQRTLQRHLEVLKSTPGAVPELLQALSDEVNSMEDPEKHVIDVGEVEIQPDKTVDLNSEQVLGVSADPLTDTPE
ncbi:uncharacterized protein LOC119182934 isoform X3 [Rhipicephalus microplus]|uniref:uncharacterized protein LOC119182934 isoform X3 n=1 Tax=Rhipicephalus microplus TaxID=6941 RepID=UPI003F6B5B5B